MRGKQTRAALGLNKSEMGEKCGLQRLQLCYKYYYFMQYND